MFPAFCTCPPSGNQVDGLPLALSKSNKDAESASWLRSGRACDHKICSVFLSFEEVSYINERVNNSNLAPLYIKALIGAIESLK